MKSVRLLPVVVLAAFSLLVLKGIGLVTEGAYVLGGTTAAMAQAHGAAAEPAAAAHPAEEAGGHGEADAHGEAAADPNADMSATDPAAAAAEPPLDAAGRAAEAIFAAPPVEPPADSEAEMTPDATPMALTKAGEKIPLDGPESASQTEQAVLARLGERRTELDSRETALNSREELVAAAEKRIDERVASLEGLEARIKAMVDERKALDDATFAGIVSMYEQMKPADAAAIFNDLQMDVLSRVARAMNPRKLAPVMAKMTTQRAQDLTLRLAEHEAEPTLDVPVDQLSSLPQIVGK